MLRVLAEGVTVAIDGNVEASDCTVDTAATVAWMLWLLAVLRSAGGQAARTGAGEASVGWSDGWTRAVAIIALCPMDDRAPWLEPRRGLAGQVEAP